MEPIKQFFDHNGKNITEYFYQYGYVSLLAYNGDQIEDSPISVFYVDNSFGKFNINVENILNRSVAVYLQSL